MKHSWKGSPAPLMNENCLQWGPCSFLRTMLLHTKHRSPCPNDHGTATEPTSGSAPRSASLIREMKHQTACLQPSHPSDTRSSTGVVWSQQESQPLRGRMKREKMNGFSSKWGGPVTHLRKKNCSTFYCSGGRSLNKVPINQRYFRSLVSSAF